MDGVAVYYQPSRPAAVGALAYTQGNQVYIGPGQLLNDDTALKREADSYR